MHLRPDVVDAHELSETALDRSGPIKHVAFVRRVASVLVIGLYARNFGRHAIYNNIYLVPQAWDMLQLVIPLL